ncbi:MAG: tetratricopeptide repeat protein, partial [Myxococcales bacterium]|nr:tetratricopeptide repeat protein [Myxococcales bacterium]
TVSALAASVTLGKTQAPGLRSGVPWHLRQAVLRGLSPDPTARHPSMAELLAILERDPSRTRRNAVAFGVAACTLAASFGVGSLFDPAQRRCDRGAEAIDQVWSDARRGRIADAFVAAGVPQPEVRWAELEPLLDARAEQWRAAFADACAATHVRGEQSGERLDARMRCLHDRRERLDALVGELETVDAEMVTRALSATLSLPAIEVCDDPEDSEFVARAREFEDAEHADRLAAAERALALATARTAAGRYPLGIVATTVALAELGDDDVPWLRGEILVVRAQLQHRVGESVTAEQTVRDALRVAVPAGQHDVAARAWFELLYIVGAELARPSEALAMQLSAELELAAVGENPAMRRKLEGVLASVHLADAQFERALEHHEIAVALAERPDVPPLTRAIVYSNYGNTLYELGRYAAALEAHERAHDLALATVGDTHPMLAIDMMSVARDLERLGDVERARGLYQRSVALREASLGPDARGVAESLLNLAVLESNQLEFAAAREHGLRALEIFQRALGPDHPHVAAAYNHLGNIAHAEGDLDGAMHDFDEVARIFEARFGPTYPKLAVAHKNRGNVLLDRGEYERAIDLFDRALEIDMARLGPDHPSLAFEYIGKARALLALDRAAEALPLAERAVALREGVTSDSNELTLGYFVLAQALWSAPDADDEAKQRALASARRALVVWRSSGLDEPGRTAMYETWLRERGGDTSLAEG